MASSKSRLFEICAANRWKQPSFECYEQGPCHKKLMDIPGRSPYLCRRWRGHVAIPIKGDIVIFFEHQRFKFKVTIEVQLQQPNATTVELECWGSPQHKKKPAEQDAVEGALWYLNHLGTNKI